ncbi:phosphoribosyltransferase family protein [Terrabacter sp. LjRoot27]|uniref:ComF family protein n=1 Tax=Terrabacter sp. LjRoot27 TaxID=3342306 RepID=UPI003ED00E11
MRGRRGSGQGSPAREVGVAALGRSVAAAVSGGVARVRDSDLVDLVLPRECGGCLRPGAVWCARCQSALVRLAFGAPGSRDTDGRSTHTPVAPGGARVHGGGPWVVPHPVPDGMPPVHAWGVYADPLRAAVSAWKDVGRRDLEAVLVPLLAASLDAALTGVGWDDGVVVVVPAPSSRRAVRERGDTPMTGLCEAAVTRLAGRPGPTLRVAPALRHVRRVEDQSGLGTIERRGNLAGALSVIPLWHSVIRGRRCLLVDDVVTTGATFAEAARALRTVGAGSVVGASLAATQRTRG